MYHLLNDEWSYIEEFLCHFTEVKQSNRFAAKLSVSVEGSTAFIVVIIVAFYEVSMETTTVKQL